MWPGWARTTKKGATVDASPAPCLTGTQCLTKSHIDCLGSHSRPVDCIAVVARGFLRPAGTDGTCLRWALASAGTEPAGRGRGASFCAARTPLACPTWLSSPDWRTVLPDCTHEACWLGRRVARPRLPGGKSPGLMFGRGNEPRTRCVPPGRRWAVNRTWTQISKPGVHVHPFSHEFPQIPIFRVLNGSTMRQTGCCSSRIGMVDIPVMHKSWGGMHRSCIGMHRPSLSRFCTHPRDEPVRLQGFCVLALLVRPGPPGGSQGAGGNPPGRMGPNS